MPDPNPRSDSGASKDSDPSMDPLFGASPPPSSSTSTNAPAQAQTSENRASFSEQIVTASPMYGASPDMGPSSYSHNHIQYTYNKHIPTTYNSKSNLLTLLRRFTYIISILLGASSLIALAWSTFLLPLLHASFSARNVLVSQHLTKMVDFVRVLNNLRARKIYPLASTSTLVGTVGNGNDKNDNVGEGEEEQTEVEAGTRREASLKEINSPPSPSPSTSSQDNDKSDSVAARTSESATDAEAEADKSPHIPLGSLDQLSKSLRELTSSLDATSTTRTSLISTLESYTSQIHRQLFVPRQFNNFGGGVGLGSLSAHLQQVGGSSSDIGGGGVDRGEEWDSVRKEVRAIKGLLLNRRAFVNSS